MRHNFALPGVTEDFASTATETGESRPILVVVVVRIGIAFPHYIAFCPPPCCKEVPRTREWAMTGIRGTQIV
eukprot:2180827-Rhodomonas_salina.1